MIPRLITGSQDCGRESRKGEEAADSANGELRCLHMALDAGKAIMTFMIFHGSLVN
jgi:hypothetical protein